MLWFLTDTARFMRERRALDLLVAECDWLTNCNWKFGDGMLVEMEFDLRIGDKIYEAVLIYPGLFPDIPAYIKSRKQGERWSIHQYTATGTLCLEWGPDNWTPNITGADLVRNAHKLLATEGGHAGEITEVPSRHRVSLGGSVLGESWRMVVTPEFFAHVTDIADKTMAPVKYAGLWHVDGRAIHVFLPKQVGDEGSASYLGSEIPKGVTEMLGTMWTMTDSGWLFKSSAFKSTQLPKTVEELLEVIHDAGFSDFQFPTVEQGKSPAYFLTLVGTTGFISVLQVQLGDSPSVTAVKTIFSNGQHTNRLSAHATHIKDKKVAIAGLGSVGSKVAISLLRQGVRRFVLVEEDILLPENLSRNELTWAEVGINKAVGVRERMLQIAADIEVDIRYLNIGGQTSATYAASVLESVSDCDIIVDTTANPTAFTYLAAVAQRTQKPIVWGAVYAGGIGAEMMRSRPGAEPGPLHVRYQVQAYLETQPKSPFKMATDYDVELEDADPIIASDGEVGEFAYKLARFVIDSMLDPAKQEFPHSAYLIGLKRGWIFNEPFDTLSIPIKMPLTKASEKTDADPERDAAVQAILNMLTAKKDADAKDPI